MRATRFRFSARTYGIKSCNMTKVVAINGSARKDVNTAILIRCVLEELEK